MLAQLPVLSLLLAFVSINPLHAEQPLPGTPPSFRAAPSVSASAGLDTTETPSNVLSVFIDCESHHCDFDYFRREITFVSYVRNRQDADVHVLITTQEAGGGGTAFTLNFIGQRRFSETETTLTHTSDQTATDDDIRRGLSRVLKAGLLQYVVQTPAFNRIEISYERPEAGTRPTVPTEDPWNLWVFRTSIGGSFEGEQKTSSHEFRGSFSANRTARDWKLDFDFDGEFDRRTFEINDSTTVTDTRRNGDFDALIVRSISDHWSVGGFGSAGRSTFDNYDLSARFAPALEYNLFPYAQSTRRQLRVLYRVGVNSYDYSQETIFGQTAEVLFQQSLEVTLDLEQPWGSVITSVEGSHFLHDFSRKRLEAFSSLELNIYKGLSLDLFGRISLIRDQLNLPAGDVPTEDILLRRRQLATNYSYDLSLGISYTFGATTNNIVNPRFGD